MFERATILIRILNALIVSFFACIQFVFLTKAMGETPGLGLWYL